MENTKNQDSEPLVLIVDDDEFSLEILRRKLALLGLTNVQLASNGFAALRVLEKLPRPPEYLICDIFMPDMDGIEFVSELAMQRFAGGLMLVTGVNLTMLEVARDIATLKGLNVLGVFQKPVHEDALRKAMGLSASL